MGALNTIPPNPFPPSTEQQGDSGAAYVLPIASAETLGGVKVGDGLNVNAETGVLSANKQIVDYSTTEQNTGIKWIDGKDIFSKTIAFGALPASSEKDVSSGLTNINIIKMEAVATSSDDTLYIPYNAANNFVGLLYIYNTDSVRIWSNTDLSSHDAVVTLYYTKTESEG